MEITATRHSSAIAEEALRSNRALLPARVIAPLEPTGKTFVNWKRVIGFSVLLSVLADVVGFLQGITFGSLWQLYGATLSKAVSHARLVRRIIIVFAAFATYFVFFRGLRRNIVLHAVAAFALVVIISALRELLIAGTPLAEAISPLYTAIHVSIVVVALIAIVLLRRLGSG